MALTATIVLSVLAGLASVGIPELLDSPFILLGDVGFDEVCTAPTVKCSGGWQALAESVSEVLQKKHKLKQRNMFLELARQEMEAAGMDVFQIPFESAVSLEEDFFHFIEEVVSDMKKHSSTKQYDVHVAQFMNYILKRIQRDLRLLNKTVHIDLIGPDGNPTGLAPVIEFLDEHAKSRDEEQSVFLV